MGGEGSSRNGGYHCAGSQTGAIGSTRLTPNFRPHDPPFGRCAAAGACAILGFSMPFVVAGPKPAFGGPRTAAFLLVAGRHAVRCPPARATARLASHAPHSGAGRDPRRPPLSGPCLRLALRRVPAMPRRFERGACQANAARSRVGARNGLRARRPSPARTTIPSAHPIRPVRAGDGGCGHRAETPWAGGCRAGARRSGGRRRLAPPAPAHRRFETGS